MLISQLCFVTIFCFHLLSWSSAVVGRLFCVTQQFALAGSDKGAISFSAEEMVEGLEKSKSDTKKPATE